MQEYQSLKSSKFRSKLLLVAGLSISVLCHGAIFLLPLPSKQQPEIILKPEFLPPPVKPIKLARSPLSKPKPAPSLKATPPPQVQLPVRKVQPPIVASQPSPSPVKPSPSPTPVQPSPTSVAQQPPKPDKPLVVDQFAEFPRVTNASRGCNSQAGDCWQVKDTRWHLVRDDLKERLEKKGQSLQEMDFYDDPEFRVYGVYENGQVKSYVHVLSVDQIVTYLISAQSLDKEAVKAKVFMTGSSHAISGNRNQPS